MFAAGARRPIPQGTTTEHGDLKALMEHTGVQCSHLLGISNGGRIAIDFAIAFPEMVDKLVLVAPGMGGFDYPGDDYADGLEREVQEAMEAGDIAQAAELEARLWVDGPKRRPEDVNRAFRERALAFIRETLEIPEGEGIGSMLEPRAVGRLEEIQAETLILFGDQDVKQLEAVARELDERVTNSRLLIMPGVAHLPNMENPEAFNRIVLDFLQE